eukprot:ctg_2642.g454
MVRPLRQLVTDLQHSETVRVVRALQELWVERSAFGDCGLAADVLLETLVHRVLLPPPPPSSSAVDDVDEDEQELALESGLPGERQAELLARGEGYFRARQTGERGALERRRGARRVSGGGGDEREDNLERVDEEPFTERAEELLLLLANELHRDRLRVSRRDDRGAGRLWLSSSLLSLHMATLLRSERSKAKALGLLLLTRMPYAMTAKTVSLDNGRVVRTLLSDHVFLRQVAARALSQVLHKLVREVHSSATDLPDGMHAQYVQWLQRDVEFSRNLLALYRGLLAALDDEDDEVFLEALRGLLRLAKVDDTSVAPDADAFAEHIFTTLDAVGPWLVRRFHRLEASERKAQFLESMAGLVAHSVRRHEERTLAQQTTSTAREQPRDAAATVTNRVAQPDWAFSFFSKRERRRSRHAGSHGHCGQQRRCSGQRRDECPQCLRRNFVDGRCAFHVVAAGLSAGGTLTTAFTRRAAAGAGCPVARGSALGVRRLALAPTAACVATTAGCARGALPLPVAAVANVAPPAACLPESQPPAAAGVAADGHRVRDAHAGPATAATQRRPPAEADGAAGGRSDARASGQRAVPAVATQSHRRQPGVGVGLVAPPRRGVLRAAAGAGRLARPSGDERDRRPDDC